MNDRYRIIELSMVKKEYYIFCYDCDRELCSRISERNVAEMAIDKGWRYDSYLDGFLCNECLRKREEVNHG